MKSFFIQSVVVCFTLFLSLQTKAQNHSVARKWNEILLEGIRNDLARPTVHARNLFHISAAMYDAWAVYDNQAQTYLLGKTLNGKHYDFEEFIPPSDIPIKEQQNMAVSYAAYRMIHHRFEFAPGRTYILGLANKLMEELGYDASIETINYFSGSAAALGNYIAFSYINYGLVDGSNEEFDYVNFYYSPANPQLAPANPGNPNIVNMNRWQPLALTTFVDQSGHEVQGGAREFLGAEWGNVWPFSLNEADKTVYTRDDQSYVVYEDPGPPPFIEEEPATAGGENDYKWNFELVAIWSSHLDPTDGVMWNISPSHIGNIESLPAKRSEYKGFFNEFDGGDSGKGYALNPKTGKPYPDNIVPRGDYTRVLAEFWADGPASETPPGHWFTILNYVNDRPELEKRFKGEGEVLDDLEWDVKAYFVLGGAMHDAAISAWGIKGWYDYIRPISAIRAMADLGQSSNPELASYNEHGITLKEGFIELVKTGDALAGANNINIGKIKIRAWKGPEFIQDPGVDDAGVDWILAENWWPYQRPTFVTPPFAGYISGHSTYSRTASVIMTLLTGDEYFPGGVGEFVAPKNEFLVFEEGPSRDIALQWATYRDASDQTSLSRIWGGIHPPADDIPGRIIGEKLAPKVFAFAEQYFKGVVTSIEEEEDLSLEVSIGPNPVDTGGAVEMKLPARTYPLTACIRSLEGKAIREISVPAQETHLSISTEGLAGGLYLFQVKSNNWAKTVKILIKN